MHSTLCTKYFPGGRLWILGNILRDDAETPCTFNFHQVVNNIYFIESQCDPCEWGFLKGTSCKNISEIKQIE